MHTLVPFPTVSQTFARLFSPRSRLVMFVYFCIKKDQPAAKWDGQNQLTAPVSPEVLESYVEFIRRKFPEKGNAEYSIEKA